MSDRLLKESDVLREVESLLISDETRHLNDLEYGNNQALYHVIDRIEDLPSTNESEWIPCSKRLPEEHEWIGTKKFGTTISDKVHITFDVNGERFVRVMSLQNGELSNSDKKTMDVFYKGWKMLAWKPLPEPWKGVSTDIDCFDICKHTYSEVCEDTSCPYFKNPDYSRCMECKSHTERSKDNEL